MKIDIRTVFFISIIIFFTCTLFISELWRQNRDRYTGIGYWLLCFSMETTALFLVILRGTIPAFISVMCANVIIVAGFIVLFIGLERFVERRSSQVPNYVLLAVFTGIHAYFTYVHDSLSMRYINVSAAILVIGIQCCWLLIRRAGQALRKLTFVPAMVFAGYCIVSIARILWAVFSHHSGNSYFSNDLVQGVIVTVYLILFILQTYSLILMVNRRLLADIGIQEDKFIKAFHSAPYAIILSRLSDGTMIEVNDGFAAITGYSREEVIGKKTMDLHIWESIDDRAAVVDFLSKSGTIMGMDLRFRKKNGDPIVGNFSAHVIQVNDEKCILSSIGDITDRKQSEEKIRKLLSEKELLLKEVHHRIKNNMYSISRLLALHAGATKEPAAVKAIQDAVSRVQSVMVLYEKLYQSVDYNEASVKDYLPALVNEIVGIFVQRDSVKIINEVDDFILDSKRLQTLGIIINELITNTMKYAFTGQVNTLRGSASCLWEFWLNSLTAPFILNGKTERKLPSPSEHRLRCGGMAPCCYRSTVFTSSDRRYLPVQVSGTLSGHDRFVNMSHNN